MVSWNGTLGLSSSRLRGAGPCSLGSGVAPRVTWGFPGDGSSTRGRCVDLQAVRTFPCGPMRALCCFGVPGGRLSVSESDRFGVDKVCRAASGASVQPPNVKVPRSFERMRARSFTMAWGSPFNLTIAFARIEIARATSSNSARSFWRSGGVSFLSVRDAHRIAQTKWIAMVCS